MCKSLYYNHIPYARPIEMFLSEIDSNKYNADMKQYEKDLEAYHKSDAVEQWKIIESDASKAIRFLKTPDGMATRPTTDRVKEAMAGLKSAGGYLRRELGRNLQLRYAPEIVWSLDDSITYGAKMLKLINSLETGHEDTDES